MCKEEAALEHVVLSVPTHNSEEDIHDQTKQGKSKPRTPARYTVGLLSGQNEETAYIGTIQPRCLNRYFSSRAVFRQVQGMRVVKVVWPR